MAITSYLKENWTETVLRAFSESLFLKMQLLQKHPKIGFKSTKYSRFRKTLITKHYVLIYIVSEDHIVIHRLKHASMA